jgi:hypothetical protein
MRIPSRSVAVVGLFLATIFFRSSAVLAADWPHRTVRLIAPIPAGTDQILALGSLRSDFPSAGGRPSSLKIGPAPME